ncbi:uncharacterized protein EDB93DRAFT_1249698 [Suillus bovinus]|uniref:uncharacterized protein n=1 Tax=Suillus bovinus TaxID=48563 RepID=UPI001B883D8E|nr:uncharacterized protein EDB93DRAFT_1249698 [Suillus bovinus]KAG2150687.1 hypothetical protein EDB93DRAFT_1249698 [Suillus bovinus]
MLVPLRHPPPFSLLKKGIKWTVLASFDSLFTISHVLSSPLLCSRSPMLPRDYLLCLEDVSQSPIYFISLDPESVYLCICPIPAYTSDLSGSSFPLGSIKFDRTNVGISS